MAALCETPKFSSYTRRYIRWFLASCVNVDPQEASSLVDQYFPLDPTVPPPATFVQIDADGNVQGYGKAE